MAGLGWWLQTQPDPGSASQEGLAPLQPAAGHSHMDQVLGHSCLWPSPANLEGLDAPWGRECEGYKGCSVLGISPWQLPPWLLSLLCPTGAPRLPAAPLMP